MTPTHSLGHANPANPFPAWSGGAAFNADTTDDGAFINVVATNPQSEAAAGKLFGRLSAVAAP